MEIDGQKESPTKTGKMELKVMMIERDNKTSW